MEKSMNIPAAFAQTIATSWDDAGRDWLRQLPAIVRECEEQWGIRAGKCLPDLSISWVAEATTRDGNPAILKVGFPHPELFTEMDALAEFRGQSCVQLLSSDRDLGALLLERIDPGTMLTEVQRKDDEDATAIAAQVMRSVSVIPRNAGAFPRVEDWAAGLAAPNLPNVIPREMTVYAQEIAEMLGQSAREERLLHGDLHHMNILRSSARGWTAIDPKGVIGDPAFEAARFLRNGSVLESPDPSALTRRRVEILSAELGYEPGRIAGWGYVDCMIGACWSAEDGGGDWAYPLECARILGEILTDCTGMPPCPASS
jgi:streptomycin 6-kinase